MCRRSPGSARGFSGSVCLRFVFRDCLVLAVLRAALSPLGFIHLCSHPQLLVAAYGDPLADVAGQ